ncbi:MAG: STAS domain-containing protein [Flavobacteriales bacterium]
MNFEIEKTEKYAIVKSKVEKLDTTVAPELKAEFVLLDKSGFRNLIIDLNETRYCDSSGLSALLVANRLTKAANGTLVITGLQGSVEKLITISQLHTVLNIVPSIEEAIDFVFMEEVERDLDSEQ